MRKFIIAVAVVVMAAIAAPAFAATNPFMDVPASHWAYDAVAQLASRGVISGYPDGSYKGAQPATRYEMASIVARAMARIDMEKASKQDVEMLKRLIVEFKDELDALGVKVDRIDERLKVLETDIGGWSLSGQFRFDANFGMDETKGWYGDDMAQAGKNDFDLNRYRIFLNKRINETTTFSSRFGKVGSNGGVGQGNSTMRWERYFITMQLGYGIEMIVGRSEFNWEDEAGLVAANGPMFGDYVTNMFRFKKDWGMANLEFVVGRLSDDDSATYNTGVNDLLGNPITAPSNRDEYFLFAGRAHFDITEKFMAGIMAYYQLGDEDVTAAEGGWGRRNDLDNDMLTAGIYLGYDFTPSVALKGLYYHQKQGDAFASRTYDITTGALTGTYDDANAWKIILDVKQDALKFTSLWLEYAQMDNNFHDTQNAGNFSYAFNGANMLHNRNRGANGRWISHPGGTTKIFGGIANQQWNDKWRTYLGYYQADFDTAGLDDAKNWTVGVGYRLNPAVEFELSYDNIDYGNVDRGAAAGAWRYNNGGRIDDDHQIRFRTFVTF